MASRQPRKPSIGLNSCSSRARSRELLRVGAHGGGDLGDLLLGVRQELVQRRIEQPDGDRQALHDLEQLDEIAALHRQELGERRAPRLLVVGQDHLAHRPDAVLVEEHVLGAAEPDALGAELDARRRASAGVSALARTPSLRTSSAQPISVANSPDSSGSSIGTVPASTWPVEPSMVIDVAALERHAAGLQASARRSRRGASPRRRRRACPCRAPPPPRGRSCRRAW